MEAEICSLAPPEWPVLRIEEVCKRVTSGGTPSRSYPDFYINGTIPWVKTQELQDTWIDNTDERITEEAVANSSAKVLPANTVLMAMYGATVGQLGILRNPMTCNQACCALIVDPEKADFLYVFHQLRHSRTQLRSLATGAAQQNLSGALIKSLRYPYPPLAEQKAIASVLGALDDKIELNRRMNATLEAMARALFQSWFVDFDPVRAKLDGRQPAGLDANTTTLFPAHFQDSPLGHIPQGWRVVALHELTSYLNRGIGPAYIDTGGVCVLNQKCVRDHRVEFSKARQHDPMKKAIDGRTLQLFDILVNSTGVGTLGRVAQVMHLPGKTIVDSHLTVVRAASEVDACFLGVALTLRESDIEELGEGSTGQTELSRARLGGLLFVAPPPQLQKAFGLTVQPLFKRIAENDLQSHTLAILRDTLLPKLLNGELRFEQVEQIAPNVVQFPDHASDRTAKKTTDEFVEAVVISQLVRKLATTQYPLGRKRYNKLAYLAHRKAEDDVTQHYLKKAAGPYSPWAKYGGPERIALQKGYVKQAKSGALEGLIAGDKIDKIDNYVPNYPVCVAIDWVTGKFRFKKNDDLELLATVDFAALDLLCNGKDVTAVTIKEVIATNKEWSPKLNRAIFSDENIDRALVELAGLFPATYAT